MGMHIICNFSCSLKCIQKIFQLKERSFPVTDGIFFFVGNFAKSFIEIFNPENRIEAKPVVASFFVYDIAFAIAIEAMRFTPPRSTAPPRTNSRMAVTKGEMLKLASSTPPTALP